MGLFLGNKLVSPAEIVNSGGSATLITKSITENGTYNASSDNADGYSSVTVNVSGSSPDGYIPKVNRNGTLSAPRTAFTYTLPSGVTSIPMYGLSGAFSASGLTSISGLSSVTIIGYEGMIRAFSYCTNLSSVDLSSLTTVDTAGLNGAFDNCTSLTSVNLSSLITVDTNGLNSAFQDCTNLTSVDLSNLTSVNNYGLMNAFSYCTNLINVDLSSLTTLGYYAVLSGAFQNCTNLTSLSFPSLEEQSWWEEEDMDEHGLFTNMLYGVTGCTVHFPSNLESTVGTWSDTLAGFGGTNTTILFDLPSTAV